MNKNKANHFFGLAALLVTFSFIFQDFLFSEVNNSSFYIGEVLLFKIFWLCYIPFSYLIFFLHSKIKKLSRKPIIRIQLYVLTVLLILSVHVMTSSFLISTLGSIWYGYRFTTWQLATTKLIDYLGVAFLFYFLAIWIAEYTSQTSLKLKNNKENFLKNENRFLTIRNGKKIIPIDVSKIKWIESDKPYIAIQTDEGKYLQNTTLKKILKEIDNPNFVRIHRSTIINISKIEKMVSRLNGDYDVLMEGGRTLRLSRTYKNKLDEKLFYSTS